MATPDEIGHQEGFLELFLIGRRHRWIQWLCLCVAALMLSCGYASDTRKEKRPVDRLLEPVPHDRYADDVGRFLAGLPARSDSPLAGFQDNATCGKTPASVLNTTTATLNALQTSVNNNAATTAQIVTPSIAASNHASVVVGWATAFTGDDYTVALSVEDTTGFLQNKYLDASMWERRPELEKETSGWFRRIDEAKAFVCLGPMLLADLRSA